MSEAAHIGGEGAPIQEFSKEVEIGGLSYIFKGTVNGITKEVSLNLLVPPGEETGEKVSDGVIGYVNASEIPEADLYIEKIQSFSDVLPSGSKYFDVQGIGRFLMDHLLSIADARGWSVAGFPYTNGRLDNREVSDWMERKGFTDTKGDYMIRPAKMS